MFHLSFLDLAWRMLPHSSSRCCSIILPTMISLCGFLVVNLITRNKPNYPSLSLSLDQYNPGIAVERNPIPFNNPGTYDCQPGRCIYQSSKTTVEETSEEYFFCGANAVVNTSSCSITDSSNIISQVSQYGTFAVAANVSDIRNVSQAMCLGWITVYVVIRSLLSL